MNITEKINLAYNIKLKNFGDEINFSYPNKTIALSTTNNGCSLSCAHCNGHYLKNMTPINLYEEIIKHKNIKSILISGGCSHDGDVPINMHIDKLDSFKKSGYKINSHIGLMNEKNIEKVCKYIDIVSFDLVIDEDTIKEVYKMNKSKKDYITVYENIKKFTQVVPHICIGIKGGKVKGEYDIIDYLAKEPPKQITFIVLIPTKGTEYENVDPPNLNDVANVLCEARIRLPKTKINLGCMRPRGSYRQSLDVLAYKCGVNNIVLPSKSLKDIVSKHNTMITKGEECCVL